MLYVVGFGPGSYGGMTVDARSAISVSDIVVGYTTYTGLIKEYFPDKEYVSTGMKEEHERVEYALNAASEGRKVSLICSGDSGVYGMACLALEMGQAYPDTDIEIVSGVTAALSGGAVLGAPLTNDFAVISLSDLMTPWEKIKKRLEYASMADLTIVLYNPSSVKRKDHLKKACDIMLRYKSPETVCGFVKNIGRNGEESGIIPLSDLRNRSVDMFTTVFIGNSETREINGRMITSRGYRNV